MNVPFSMKRAFLECRAPIEKFIAQNRVYEQIQRAMDNGNTQATIQINHVADVGTSILIAYLTYQGYTVKFSSDETILYVRWIVD